MLLAPHNPVNKHRKEVRGPVEEGVSGTDDIGDNNAARAQLCGVAGTLCRAQTKSNNGVDGTDILRHVDILISMI